MLTVNQSQIKVTRGDTAIIDVYLVTEGGEPYEMQEDDVLEMTVRKRADDRFETLLYASSDEPRFTLTPEQTGRLPVGELSCDMQLVTSDGNVFTFWGAKTTSISLRNFIVLPEVTIP